MEEEIFVCFKYLYHNEIKSYTISFKKEKLIQSTNFFKSLLSGCYKDSGTLPNTTSSKILKINLTDIAYHIDITHLNILGRIINNEFVVEDLLSSKNIMKIKCNPDEDYKLKQRVEFNLGVDIMIKDLLILNIICHYFQINIDNINKKILSNYQEIYDFVFYSNKTELKGFQETVSISIKHPTEISYIQPFLDKIKYTKFQNYYESNYYFIFWLCYKFGHEKTFDNIAKIYSQINFHSVYTNCAHNQWVSKVANFPLKSNIQMSTRDILSVMSIEDFIDIRFKIFNMNNIKNINNYECVNLYDYYEMFKKIDCVIQTDIQSKYKNTHLLNKGEYTICSYQEVMNRFKQLTNGIFDDFDWKNIILTGNFLYAIITKNENAIKACNRISLQININNVNSIIRTLTYFSKYDPYYAVDKHNDYLIFVPNLPFIIKIYRTGTLNKKSIASNILPPKIFYTNDDYNDSYKNIYFNGKNVTASLNGMISLKLGVNINYDDFRKEIITKYQKTLKLGLDIIWFGKKSDDNDKYKLLKNEPVEHLCSKTTLINLVAKNMPNDVEYIIKKLFDVTNVNKDVTLFRYQQNLLTVDENDDSGNKSATKRKFDGSDDDINPKKKQKKNNKKN